MSKKAMSHRAAGGGSRKSSSPDAAQILGEYAANARRPADGGFDSVCEARRSYLKLVSKRRLLPEPVAAAVAATSDEPHALAHLAPDFAAVMDGLAARPDLPAEAFEKLFSELMAAEYECDQAEWERQCYQTALAGHAQFRMAPPQPSIRRPHSPGRPRKPVVDIADEAMDDDV